MAGFWVTVLNLDMSGCFLGSESVGLGAFVGGWKATMLSLLPWEAFKGPSGDVAGRDADLEGECLEVLKEPWELRAMLASLLWSGRRGGFTVAGIGAWLIKGATASEKSSWRIRRGPAAEKRVGLAMVASSSP